MTSGVTCGQLRKLLLDLNFVEDPAKRPWEAFRHDATGTLILLARREASLPTPEADLISVRRHLVENGILDEGQFEDFISLSYFAESA